VRTIAPTKPTTACFSWKAPHGVVWTPEFAAEGNALRKVNDEPAKAVAYNCSETVDPDANEMRDCETTP
jgi:hypothetical protein